MIQALFQSLGRRWVRFWFLTENVQQFGLFRKVFGALMVFFTITRTADLEFFYGDKGMLPLSALSDAMDMHYRYSIFQLFPSNAALWIGHVLLVGSLIFLTLGIYPRVSAAIAFFMNVSFIHRNMTVAYGVDVIANFYLFYLCFADWRVRKGAGSAPDFRSMLGSLVYRLAQIQICIIYAYSGLEKVRGTSWWNGEALWYVFANSQLSRIDMTWISHYPSLIVVMTYVTLAWEVYFPVLIWVRGIRPLMIFVGVMLHVGIAVGMNLTVFGILMISTYILFIDELNAQRVTRFVAKMLLPRKVSLQAADESFV